MIPVRLQVGTVLGGRYEIRSLLGQGGMAVVYRAHDRTLDDEVALKCLRTEISAPNLTKRFLAEIKLARKVRHKNVCGIHEYGEEGGFRYIAMELIEGINLKQLVKEQGPLDSERARELMIQLAEGLEAIHEVGVIHRDLKTSNIMLDSSGLARLMDFGIAKELGFDTQTSSSGSILGTPEYMSPEQINGDDLTYSSDIYALGIVLFELLTGDVPFWGDSPVVTLYKQLHEQPPLDDPRIAAAPALRAILARSLAKDPEQRYQRAVDVAAALRRAVGLVTLPPEPMPGATEVLVAPPAEAPAEEASAAPETPDSEPTILEPLRPEPWPGAPPAAGQPEAPPERGPESFEEAEAPVEEGPAPEADYQPVAEDELDEPEPEPYQEPAPPVQASGHVRAVPQAPRYTSRPVAVLAPAAPSWMPLVWGGLGLGLLAIGIGAGALYRHLSQTASAPTTLAREQPLATPTPRADVPIEEGVTVVERMVPIEEDIMIVGEATPPPTVSPSGPPPTQLAGGLPPATLPLRLPPTTTPPSTAPAITLAPATQPARPDAGAQVVALLEQGERSLLGRDFAGAGESFRKAAELEPGNERAVAGQKRAAAGLAAATRAFKQGRTVVEAKSAEKGPPGFESADVALKKAPDFSGRIEFEVSPPDAKPGQGFVVHVFVANDGKKTVKVSRAMVTTTQNGSAQPQAVAVEGKSIEPRTRTLLAEVPMSWSEATQTWSMDVAVTSRSNETMRNRLVWR